MTTRKEQDERIDELMEWSAGDLALHVVALEAALRECLTLASGYYCEFPTEENRAVLDRAGALLNGSTVK